MGRRKEHSLVEILHDVGKSVSSAREYEDKFDKIWVGASASSKLYAVWGWEEDAQYIKTHEASKIMNGTKFVKYGDHVSAMLESEYQLFLHSHGEENNRFKVDLKNAAKKVRNTHTGLVYIIDFVEMTQTNTQTGYERAIRREEHFKSSSTEILKDLPPLLHKTNYLATLQGQIINVTKKSPNEQWYYGRVLGVLGTHHPSTFTTLEGWFPVMLCKPTSATVLNKALASMSVAALAPNLTPPKTWENGKEGRVAVPTQSAEHRKVIQYFERALQPSDKNKIAVASVERIQSNELWRIYAVKNDSMINRYSTKGSAILINNTADNLELNWLFHGTRPCSVPKIVRQGFNRSFAGANGTDYGKGVYFARSASYSLRYSTRDNNRMQYMFLCRVAVGDWCKGGSDQITPDPKPGRPDELFDSTVDDIDNPSIFVVYHDAQAYPEYLIKFRQT